MEDEDADTRQAIYNSLADHLPLAPSNPRPHKRWKREASHDEMEEKEDTTESSIISRTTNLIRQHGYTKINVFGDSTQPDFAYTIGMSFMTDGKVPDIIVCGLPGGVAFPLLDRLIKALERTMTMVTTPGILQINVDGLLGNELMCCLMHVTPDEFSQRALLVRKLFPNYHQQGFYMQLVWPDASNNFTISSVTQPQLYKQSMLPVTKNATHSADISVHGLWLRMVQDRLPDTGQTFL
jgi:hypothetical protein